MISLRNESLAARTQKKRAMKRVLEVPSTVPHLGVYTVRVKKRQEEFFTLLYGNHSTSVVNSTRSVRLLVGLI